MQSDLFGDKREIPLQDGSLTLWSNILPFYELLPTYAYLENGLAWRQDEIQIMGKLVPVPRLNVLYGDEGLSYAYSGVRFPALTWTEILWKLKVIVEELTGCRFNSVLCNFYRDGQNSVAWHSDDEPELGEEPQIASLSFGATRIFHLRHRLRSDISPLKLSLEDNTLLLMGKGTQKNWEHQVPKMKSCTKGRINLTFRWIEA